MALPVSVPTYSRLKVGDTASTLTFLVSSGLPSLTGATVKLYTRNVAGTTVINGTAGSIGSITAASDSTAGCTLSFTSVSALTATAGRQWAEWQIALNTVPVTYAIVPSENWHIIDVVEDFH